MRVMDKVRYDVSVGNHALEKFREIAKHYANWNAEEDKTIGFSDGFIRDMMSQAVIDEWAKALPHESYPPISGGEHEFVATLLPTEQNGLPCIMKLIVVKDKVHGGKWAVATTLSEDTYNSRVASRAMRERDGTYFEEGDDYKDSKPDRPVTGKMAGLDASKIAGIADGMSDRLFESLARDSFVVLATKGGKFDKASGFDDKEKALAYANELLEDYSMSDIRVFALLSPKVKIIF